MSDIHVRLLAIDKALPAAWYNDALALLDKAEIARFNAYAHKRQRLQFLAGRWLVKSLIAQSAHIAPSSVTIAYKDGGKPYLVKPPLDTHFSITHTDKWVACCTSNQSVGIDIEALGRQPVNATKIARLLNTTVANLIDEQIDEQAANNAHSLTVDALFTLYWTAFESLVKIRGTSVFTERKAFLDEAVSCINGQRLEVRTSQDEHLESIFLGDSCLGVGVVHQSQNIIDVKKELIEMPWSIEANDKTVGNYQIKITPIL